MIELRTSASLSSKSREDMGRDGSGSVPARPDSAIPAASGSSQEIMDHKHMKTWYIANCDSGWRRGYPISKNTF
jgi:hypothetical protein